MMESAARRRRAPARASKAPHTSVRLRRIALFYLLAVGGATVATLSAGEIVVRLFDIGPRIVPIYAENYRLSENAVLGYELVPGSAYLGGSINADQMRSRDYPVAKPREVFRIACLGDSICFGCYVDFDDTIAARLEEYLNRYFGSRERRFEVMNFGVVGYNITQVVENLRVRALKYDPDVIVYLYCVNDPQEYSTEMDGLRSQLSAAERNYLDRALRPGKLLAARSRLFMLTRFVLDSATASGHKKGELVQDQQWPRLWEGTYGQYYTDLHGPEQGWPRVAAGLDTLGEIAQVRRIPTYVAIFPVLRDLASYPLLDVHAKVATAARNRSLGAVDLLPPYLALAQVPGARFARDFLHPDAPGCAYAAVVIVRELLLRGDLPVPDRDIDRLTGTPTQEAGFARLLLQRFPANSTASN